MTVRRASKIDANQPAIVGALKAVGASVQSLAGVGDGCPDLLVGCDGTNYLLEVKNRHGRGVRLTRDQKAWRLSWRTPVHVVCSVSEALDAIGLVWSTGDVDEG